MSGYEISSWRYAFDSFERLSNTHRVREPLSFFPVRPGIAGRETRAFAPLSNRHAGDLGAGIWDLDSRKLGDETSETFGNKRGVPGSDLNLPASLGKTQFVPETSPRRRRFHGPAGL